MNITENVSSDPKAKKKNKKKTLGQLLLWLHINLFITQFVITRFWIQHNSEMDPKTV